METRILRNPKTMKNSMKTNLRHKSVFIICAVMIGAFTSAFAEPINSTYVGPIGGNWSDPANWSPPIVPNNNGNQEFNVSIGGPGGQVTLDINSAINSLAFTNPGEYHSSFLNSADHNLISGVTSVGDWGLYFSAETTSVLANLGNLADFSGTTLNSGIYQVDTSYSDPSLGLTATIQFNGADIRTTNGNTGLFGAGARIVDQNGHDALAHLRHILVNGIFDLESGRSFTSAGPVVNEGVVYLLTNYFGIEGPECLTINGDYTTIGYPLDPGTEGFTGLLAAGPVDNAKMVINGRLTNYDAMHRTLNKTYFKWVAANNRSATTQVLGDCRPLDIVTSKGSLILCGPKTGFRDKFGADALRNLSTSARLQIANRTFTTAGSFTSTSRLSIFGDTRFTVNGHLKIQGGFFEVSPSNGYAVFGDDTGGFPIDPPYITSNITVRGNLNLMPGTEFLVDIFDNPTLPKIKVGGTANFRGALVPYLLDGANPTSSDSFAVLTAANIVGQFSNVANGGRVTAFSFSDGSELGTFLVTYGSQNHDHRHSLVLSDFQPNPTAPLSQESRTDTSKTSKRRSNLGDD